MWWLEAGRGRLHALFARTGLHALFAHALLHTYGGFGVGEVLGKRRVPIIQFMNNTHRHTDTPRRQHTKSGTMPRNTSHAAVMRAVPHSSPMAVWGCGEAHTINNNNTTTTTTPHWTVFKASFRLCARRTRRGL